MPYGVLTAMIKGIEMSMKALMLLVAAGLVAGAGAVAWGGSAKSLNGKLPEPGEFANRVDNPWFPLRPGTTYRYRGVKDGKRSREVFKVTRATKIIQGIRATVVNDRLYERGRLEERTADRYAQDKAGNVWYLGERTAELNRKGEVKSREGSWQAGVDGAQAGLFMPAHPRVGQSARQEYYKGHAEDHFRVLSLSARVQTPAISSRHALLTKEWTPLEPGVVDHKLYVRGIGTVREETVKGGIERNVLVSVSE
jgi:hypothetical protein